MEKKFYLSQTDKKIAGVCGGLSEYFNLDSLVVRIFVFCAVFIWGLSIWFYILLWIFAPKGPDFDGYIS